MQPDRKTRILDLFKLTLRVPPAERAAFLEGECGPDEQMRMIVESMVHRSIARRLADEDTAEAATQLLERGSEADPLVGKRIGDFKIRRHIDSGGMGRVYEALQGKPRRVVALKVMVRGVASRSALRRLEFEAQLLGRLRHPGIAQVYQAGTWNDGYGEVPYFAMEYVPNARTLTDYAEWSELSTTSRLELFVKVCDAVHHGHQKGIIHRDLKPENILVDSSRQPKVIDFGVARSTDSDLALTTLQTDVGQLIGTLQYMSPEQCEADPNDLDTRSDVYALGVVLYELLCKRPPYDVSGVPIHEAVRLIRMTTPTRPSSFNRMLRGDIETITMKALEKDRSLRYQSALDLAADIRRYLGSEVIAAKRPARAMKLGEFAVRHWRLFGAIAIVMVGLAAIAASMSVIGVKAEAQRKLAVAAQKAAEAAQRKAESKVYAYTVLAANEAAHNDEPRVLAAHLDQLERMAPAHGGWEHRYLQARHGGETLLMPLGSEVLGVAVGGISLRLAVAVRAGRVHLFEFGAGDTAGEVNSLDGVTSLAFGFEATKLVTASQGEIIDVWGVPGALRIADPELHAGVLGVRFSADGNNLLALSKGRVHMSRPTDVTYKRGLWQQGAEYVSAAIDYNGQQVAIGHGDGRVEVWRPERDPSGAKVLRFDPGPAAATALAFAGSARRIAVGYADGVMDVLTIDGQGRERLAARHERRVNSVVFSPDDSRLFSASDDSTVRLWNASTMVWIMTLRGHDAAVSSIALSADGAYLFSGSLDGTVRVWHAPPVAPQ